MCVSIRLCLQNGPNMMHIRSQNGTQISPPIGSKSVQILIMTAFGTKLDDQIASMAAFETAADDWKHEKDLYCKSNVEATNLVHSFIFIIHL